MTDIYPQSQADSHAVLSDMHPVSQKMKALEQELAGANARNQELTDDLSALESRFKEELDRERARHEITQNNLRRVVDEKNLLAGQLAAIYAVMRIGGGIV